MIRMLGHVAGLSCYNAMQGGRTVNVRPLTFEISLFQVKICNRYSASMPRQQACG